MARRMMNTMRIAAAYNGGRRRDERGRYMGGDDHGMEMRRSGMEMQGGQYPGERRSGMENRYDRSMNYGGSGESRYNGEMRRRNEMGDDDDGPEMGGEGYFVWDNLHKPIYREPESEMRREGGNVTDMREYGRRYSPQSHMDTGQQNHRQMTQQRQIGFQHREEPGSMHLPRKKAEEWVEGMKSPKWPHMEDVKMLAQKVGVTGEQEMAEFWAVLNATYSDVCKVAKKYNVDRSDFYADLTKALFLEDEDAVEGKPMLYYEYLVKKDED